MAYLKSIWIVLFAAALSACTSTPDPAEQPIQASAVSVTLPDFVTGPDTTLAWRSNLIWIDDPEGRFERRADQLQAALAREFANKGLVFATNPEAATYDVLAIAMLGPVSGHPEVQEAFRLYPALQKPSEGYRRGSVIVAIAPKGTRNVVWRGALEIFTDPDRMEPMAVRTERLRFGAQQLLASIPAVR